MLSVALGFIVGTALGNHVSLNAALVAAGATACWLIALIFLRRAWSWLPLLGCVVFLGAWNAGLRSENPSWGACGQGAGQPSGLLRVEGIVTGDTDRGMGGDGGRVGFPFRTERVSAGGEWEASKFSIWVWYSPQADTAVPAYGERWQFAGHWKMGRRGPVLYTSWRYARRLGEGQGNPILAACYSLRHRGRRVLSRGLEDRPVESGLLGALLLGYRNRLDPALQRAFSVTGTMHVFAISGLHVGVVAAMLGAALRLSGVSREKWVLVLVPALLFYTVITGMRASAVRASVMAVCLALGPMLGRRSDPPSALALAALLILAAAPGQLGDPGFQLSFVVVAGILLWLRWANLPVKWVIPDPWLPPGRIRRNAPGRVAVWALRLLLVSLAAWWASAPLAARYFHIFSPIAVPANLILIPAVSLAVLSGALSLVLGSVWAGMSVVLNRFGGSLIRAAAHFVELLQQVPAGHMQIGGFPLWLAVPWYGVVAVAAIGGWNRRARRAMLAVVLLGMAMAGWQWAHPEEQLLVWRGRGHLAVLLRSGGQAVLVDPGPRRNAGRLAALLRRAGVVRLEALVITTGDEVHCGAGARLLQETRVEQLWCPPVTTRSRAVARLLRSAREQGVRVQRMAVGGRPLRAGTVRGRMIQAIAARTPPGSEVPDTVGLLLETGFGGGVLIVPSLAAASDGATWAPERVGVAVIGGLKNDLMCLQGLLRKSGAGWIIYSIPAAAVGGEGRGERQAVAMLTADRVRGLAMGEQLLLRRRMDRWHDCGGGEFTWKWTPVYSD